MSSDTTKPSAACPCGGTAEQRVLVVDDAAGDHGTDALRDWACEPGDDGVSLRERLRAAVSASLGLAHNDEPEARPQLYRDVNNMTRFD